MAAAAAVAARRVAGVSVRLAPSSASALLVGSGAAAAVRRMPAARLALAVRGLGSSSAVCSGHGHDTTVEPPFASLPLPTKPLHEQDELVWNDGVAPEAALDFDAPFVSKTTGLLWWLSGFGFFAAVYAFAKVTAHPDNKESAPRSLPESTMTVAMGGHGKY